ncbi:MAG: hypothetical protein AAF387_14445 [Pseudomonadota bacterium]
MSAFIRPICLIVLTVVGFVEAEARVFAQDLRLTRFHDILGSVINDDHVSQREFVLGALDVMIDAYLIEIKRLDELDSDSRSSKASWRSGTLGFVARLEKSVTALERGAELFIAEEIDGSVRFVIGAEQIMFNAPRMSDQGQLEATLVDHYCLRQRCNQGRGTIEDKTMDEMARHSGSWEFSGGTKPTYTASDGLECVFRDQRHLTLKREACKSLIFELRFLAEALKALRAKGARIDWDRIALDGNNNAAPNKVTYNSKREFFHARLPKLWRAQAMLRSAIPWLQARTLGNVRSFTIQPPDIVTYSSK